MGGEISLTSNLGKGSVFQFKLKLPVDTNSLACKIESMTYSNIKTLLVDDSYVSRNILSSYLDSRNVPFESVESGSEALKKLEDAYDSGQPYELVIFDNQLPDIDSVMLAERIKSTATLKDTLTIMLSSIKVKQQIDNRSSIIDTYLDKPVMESQLFERIGKVSGNHSPQTTKKKEYVAQNGENRYPKEGNSTSELKVLLVEDNRVNQAVAVGMLKKLGCSVVTAGNGLDGLNYVKESEFDIVFMDCHMPIMDGWESSRAIREHEGDSKHTLIIAMTANAMTGDRDVCIEAGMDDYIAKPITLAILSDTLDKVRNKPGAPFRNNEMNDQLNSVRDNSVAPDNNLTLPNTPVLNMDLADEIVGGDCDLLHTVAGAFIEYTPNAMNNLEDAIASGDKSDIIRTAHTIKGSASNIAAEQMSYIAKSIELATSENQEIDYNSSFKLLEQAFEIALTEVKKL